MASSDDETAIDPLPSTSPAVAPPVAVAPVVPPPVVAVPTSAPVATLAPTACGPAIHVAFSTNRSQLISAEPLIVGGLRRVELCRPTVVTVTGKADPVEEAAAALARRRADKVADALRRQGVPAALLRIRTEVATPAPADVFQNRVAEIAFDRE